MIDAWSSQKENEWGGCLLGKEGLPRSGIRRLSPVMGSEDSICSCPTFWPALESMDWCPSALQCHVLIVGFMTMVFGVPGLNKQHAENNILLSGRSRLPEYLLPPFGWKMVTNWPLTMVPGGTMGMETLREARKMTWRKLLDCDLSKEYIAL